MLTFEEWRHTYADVFETDDAARAAWTAASNNGYRAGAQDTRALLTAHSSGAQGEIPSCDVERMRAAFESARPAVRKFHYQWDARRQRYLLDGDEDRGQYMQNEFADWCEAWCTAIAFQPMPQTDAAHSAGAQGEAVGEITDGDEGFLMRFIGAIERIESGITQTTADGLFSKTRERKMTIKDAQEIVRLMLPGLRRVAAKLYAHPQPQTDASRHLSDLLARIHRDGGHYETQYGTEKATADAEMKVAQLNEMTDAARDAIWDKRPTFDTRGVPRMTLRELVREHYKHYFSSDKASTLAAEHIAEIECLDRAKGA